MMIYDISKHFNNFLLQGPPHGCQLSTADGCALQRQRPRTPHPGGDQGAPLDSWGVFRESWVMCDWAWSLYQNSKLEWKPAAVLTAGKSMLTRLILTSLACSFRTHVAFQDSAQNSKYRSEGFWSWCGSHSHGPGLHLCGLPCGWPWIWPPFPVFATDSRTHGWGGSNLESACFPVFRLFTESMTDNDRYCSDRYLRSFTAGSVGIGEFNSGVNTLSVPGRP